MFMMIAVLPKLVEDIVKSKNVRIDNMLADGAYDSNVAVLNVLQQKMGSCHVLK